MPTPPYLLQADEQIPGADERGTAGTRRGGEHVAAVAKLIAALYNQCQGIVVAGGQLVPMKDDDLGAAHLFLSIKRSGGRGGVEVEGGRGRGRGRREGWKDGGIDLNTAWSLVRLCALQVFSSNSQFIT